MFEKKHNNNTKEFLQKIMLFIDNTMINAAMSKPDDSNKLLVTALSNVKDAIFAEIIKDNHIETLNLFLQQQKENKKKLEPKEQTGSSPDQK